VARQYAKEEREKEKKAWAEELAATRALIKQQRDAATSQKSRDTLNKGKRKTLQGASKKNSKRRRVVGARSQPDAAPALPSPPPKITTRGRLIKAPNNFEWYERCASLYIVIH
jgi:hypothetical protein